MEDGIEKIPPVNTGMEVKIQDKNKIKYRKTGKGIKIGQFYDIFKFKTEKTVRKQEKEFHAKYKNGRRIK